MSEPVVTDAVCEWREGRSHNWFRRPGRRVETYWVRLTPEEKRELFMLADAAGVVLADAFREGCREYLLDRLPAAWQPGWPEEARDDGC